MILNRLFCVAMVGMAACAHGATDETVTNDALGAACGSNDDSIRRVHDAALANHPEWNRPDTTVDVHAIGKAGRHTFFTACKLVHGALGDPCDHYAAGADCSVTRVAENSEALKSALSRFDEIVAIETWRPGYLPDLHWNPGGKADILEYTMQFRVPTENKLLVHDLLVHLKYGTSVTGRTEIDLGGSVVRASGIHENTPWTWRIDPKTVTHMQDYEVCDAWPKYVEDHLDDWLTTPNAYLCPWGLSVVAVVAKDTRTGIRSLIIPADYAPVSAEIKALYDAISTSSPDLSGASVVAGKDLPFLSE
jgi:hypothetical protein